MKKVTCYLLCIFLLLSGCSNTTKYLSADEYLEIANQYLIESKYDEAIDTFAGVLTKDARNVKAYIGLAEALIANGEIDKAITILLLGYEETWLNDEIDLYLDSLEVYPEYSVALEEFTTHQGRTLLNDLAYNCETVIIPTLDYKSTESLFESLKSKICDIENQGLNGYLSPSGECQSTFYSDGTIDYSISLTITDYEEKIGVAGYTDYGLIKLFIFKQIDSTTGRIKYIVAYICSRNDLYRVDFAYTPNHNRDDNEVSVYHSGMRRGYTSDLPYLYNSRSGIELIGDNYNYAHVTVQGYDKSETIEASVNAINQLKNLDAIFGENVIINWDELLLFFERWK